MPTKIDSPAQWRQILGSHSVVVADFYADWCGPCKMIAPTFDSLSTKYAKPGRIAFVKVDVDAQAEVAQQYSVRAMPTFLILRGGSVIDTIQGANPPALTTAVEKAVKLAGPTAGASFSGAGNRLGGAGVGRPLAARPSSWNFDPKAFMDAVVVFFGLYFWSLFSLDPYKSAERSAFNVRTKRPSIPSTGGSRLGGNGAKAPPRTGLRTMADLSSE